MAYGWEGEKGGSCRSIESGHAENSVLWMNDPAVTAWTLSGDIPRALPRRSISTGWRAARRAPLDIILAVETLAASTSGRSASPHRVRHGVAVTGTLIGPRKPRSRLRHRRGARPHALRLRGARPPHAPLRGVRREQSLARDAPARGLSRGRPPPAPPLEAWRLPRRGAVGGGARGSRLILRQASRAAMSV